MPASALAEAPPAKGVGQLVLDFDVGGKRPNKAVVSFSGKVWLRRQFRKEDHVTVQLVDAETGEVVALTGGEVVAVSFVDKRDKETGAVVETTREHKIKLG